MALTELNSLKNPDKLRWLASTNPENISYHVNFYPIKISELKSGFKIPEIKL